MVVLTMITNKEPLKNIMIKNRERPVISEEVPESYRNLIQKCLSENPNERPTFAEIIEDLKNNPNYIIEGVNINEFLDYIEYIDSYKVSFHPENPVIQIDENYNFEEEDDEDMEEESNDISYEQLMKIQKRYPKFESLEKATCNLKNFSKKSKIGEGSFGATYKVLEKKTNFIYCAKISKTEYNLSSPKSTINLNREVSIISALNHPSIIKFIAYNPKNFSNASKPVIITEYVSGGSLEDIIKTERKSITIDGWDETKKLINIYGIASAMEYLHSQEILHRDLKPENILLDKYLCPKIADFGLSKYIDDNKYEFIIKNSKNDVKGTPMYLSPEIWTQNEYSKAADVYAFALIIYEIITNQTIYKNVNIYQIFKIVCTNKERPQFTDPIPECYQSLIEECWAQDPDERPTFKEIVDLIKNDPDFVTPIIEEPEFIDYIDSIEQPENSMDSSLKKSYQKVVYHAKKKNKRTTFVHQDCFLNLSNYKFKGIIYKSEYSKIKEAIDKKTNVVYAAKISKITIDDLTESEFISLSREVNNLSQLNHPSILKFIGYSPINTKKEQKPVIITEYLKNGSLDDFLKYDEKKKKEFGWNSTKKLIIIYGIANSMSYLHSKEIMHRDLKPSNILLDDNLYPKLTDFGFSVKQHRLHSQTFQSSMTIGNKSTYSAPEVLNCEEFTKESDVYSFALISYQIITGEIPFKNILSNQQLLKEIYYNENMPKFPENTPDCYRELIEICWSQNPDDRLPFNQIVDILENNPKFILDDMNEKTFKDYVNYIKSYEISYSPNARFLEPEDFDEIHQSSNTMNESINKSDNIYDQKLKMNEVGTNHIENANIVENVENKLNEKIIEKEDKKNENENHNESIKFVEKIDQENDNYIEINDNDLNNNEEELQANIEINNAKQDLFNLNDYIDKETNQTKSNENDNSNIFEQNESISPSQQEEFNYDKDLIHSYLTQNRTKKLIQYLNENCDYETTSHIFDECFTKFPNIYNELCKEGVQLNNPVAHHKYALSIIFNDENDENKFEIARNHLEKAIQQDFTLSYFSLARLLHEHFNDDSSAFNVAKEGSSKGEKYSMFLLGFYITHGIGTQKNRYKGVSLMIQSGVEQFYQIFATDIGLFYLEQGQKSDTKNNFYKNSFIWFEKAYQMNKTKASINNYGLCFIKGIHVQRNIEKAKEIFLDGAKNGDSNSMYHLAHILEKTDTIQSIEYYKSAAKLGHIKAQIRYDSLMNSGEDQISTQFSFEFLNEDIDYQKLNEYKREAEKGSKKAQANLAKNYSKDKEEQENTYKYMMMCLKSGNTIIPLEYAINLYKNKNYKMAFKYFTIISKLNNPIAKYYIGVMKFYGNECKKDVKESYQILKDLANNGIDRAIEFIDDHAEEFMIK